MVSKNRKKKRSHISLIRKRQNFYAKVCVSASRQTVVSWFSGPLLYSYICYFTPHLYLFVKVNVEILVII